MLGQPKMCEKCGEEKTAVDKLNSDGTVSIEYVCFNSDCPKN